MLTKAKKSALVLVAAVALLACALFGTSAFIRASADGTTYAATGDYFDKPYILLESSTNINHGFTADGFSVTLQLDDSTGSGDHWAAINLTSTAAGGNLFAANIEKTSGIGLQVVADNGVLRFMPFKDTGKIKKTAIPASSRFVVAISDDVLTVCAEGESTAEFTYDLSEYQYKDTDSKVYFATWLYCETAGAKSRMKVFEATEANETFTAADLLGYGQTFGYQIPNYADPGATFTNINTGLNLPLKASEGVTLTVSGASSNAPTSGDWYNIVFGNAARHGSFGNGLSGFEIRVGEAAGWYKFYIAPKTEPGGEPTVYLAAPNDIGDMTHNSDGLAIKYGTRLKIEIVPRETSYDLKINDAVLTSDGAASLFDALNLGASGFTDADGNTFANFGAYFNSGAGGKTTVSIHEVGYGTHKYGVEELSKAAWTTNNPEFFYLSDSMTFYEHGEYKEALDPNNFEIKMSIGNNNSGDVFKTFGFFDKGGLPYGAIGNTASGVYFLVRYDSGSKQIYFCAYKMPNIVELEDDSSNKIQLRYGIAPGQPFTVSIKKLNGKYVLFIDGNEVKDAAGNGLLEKYFSDNCFLDSNNLTHFVVGSHNDIRNLPVTVYSVQEGDKIDLKALRTRDGSAVPDYTVEVYGADDVKIESGYTFESGVIRFDADGTLERSDVEYVIIKAAGYEDLKYMSSDTSNKLVLELMPYSASVTLTDKSENPVEGATIKSVSEYYAPVTATEAAGVYTLEGVRGEVSLEIEKDGFVYTGSVTLTPDDSSKTVQLEKIYTATLTLKDDSGRAVTHATVIATVGDKQVEFVNEADGTYTLAKVNGTVSATVTAVGYADEENVSFTEENATKELALTEVAYVGYVYVFDENEDAIVGASVTVKNSANGESVTVSDSGNGEYTASLSADEYNVTVTAEGGISFDGKLTRGANILVFQAEKEEPDDNNQPGTGDDDQNGDDDNQGNTGDDNNQGNTGDSGNKTDGQGGDNDGGCGSVAASASGASVLVLAACAAVLTLRRKAYKVNK